ncbi:MAG: hypothetical protein CR972_01005 [Candidatus Moraniibacteriota bacterium]|nr:MAG: hypothetical protein CR972_01005 [Candidatus Moranbacteria bacterium]
MKSKKKYIIGFLLIFIVLILCAIFSRYFVLSYSKEFIFQANEIEQLEECQNVIVLGAMLYSNGQMSGMLKERAMATMDIYNEGKVCKILISGDGASKNGSDEVKAVRQYLIENGVDKNVILEDKEGFDTFQSMKNARDIFHFENALVITQTFHLSRAVYIARALDIDARGYVAYKYPYKSQWEKRRNFFREYPAAVKAVYEVIFKD